MAFDQPIYKNIKHMKNIKADLYLVTKLSILLDINLILCSLLTDIQKKNYFFFKFPFSKKIKCLLLHC